MSALFQPVNHRLEILEDDTYCLEEAILIAEGGENLIEVLSPYKRGRSFPGIRFPKHYGKGAIGFIKPQN